MLREAAADLAATVPSSPASICHDDATLAAVAEGALTEAERRAVIPHLATCGRCRGTLAAITASLADEQVRREIAGLDRSAARRLRRFMIPAAAAAVLLLVTLPVGDRRGVFHRAPAITSEATPVTEWPVGSVSAVDQLRWRAVDGADRYRITVLDAAGALVFESETAEQMVLLPDSVVLHAGRQYLWRVEARTTWNRWSESRVVQFSISTDPRR
jgi:hypothetical protein